MTDSTVDLLDRLKEIKERIINAADRSKRNLESIKLLAVSKNHSLDKIIFFQKQGLYCFGESRVQELMTKYEEKSELDWHFIGHLQRNKVKYLMRMENCSLIHSLDSWRLAKEINKTAAKNNRIMPVLLEINIAGDKNKFGLDPQELQDFLQEASKLDNIDIQGLMTIAPYVRDSEEVRPLFKQMFIIKKNMEASGFKLKELSMGMSNDFEVAIEEGSTIVRLGSSLFGRRGG